MEEEVVKEKTKKQKNGYKIATILLSIWVCLLITYILIDTQNQKKIEIKFSNTYILQNSLYYYCELELLSKQDKILYVDNFTFKRNKEYICVDKIQIDNNTYNSGENFIINKYEKTKITLYLTLIKEDNVSTIYYNFKPINIRETKKLVV